MAVAREHIRVANEGLLCTGDSCGTNKVSNGNCESIFGGVFWDFVERESRARHKQV